MMNYFKKFTSSQLIHHWRKSSRPACAWTRLGPDYKTRNFLIRKNKANRTDIFIFVE